MYVLSPFFKNCFFRRSFFLLLTKEEHTFSGSTRPLVSGAPDSRHVQTHDPTASFVDGSRQVLPMAAKQHAKERS